MIDSGIAKTKKRDGRSIRMIRNIARLITVIGKALAVVADLILAVVSFRKAHNA